MIDFGSVALNEPWVGACAGADCGLEDVASPAEAPDDALLCTEPRSPDVYAKASCAPDAQREARIQPARGLTRNRKLSCRMLRHPSFRLTVLCRVGAILWMTHGWTMMGYLRS